MKSLILVLALMMVASTAFAGGACCPTTKAAESATSEVAEKVEATDASVVDADVNESVEDVVADVETVQAESVAKVEETSDVVAS